MLYESIFVVTFVLVLYSLTNSTEKTLAKRKEYTANDVRMVDHRSRM